MHSINEGDPKFDYDRMQEASAPPIGHVQIQVNDADTSKMLPVNRRAMLPSDIFEFPMHVKTDFDSIMNEPDYFPDNPIAQSCKKVSEFIKSWYNTAQIAVYYFLCIVFGIPLALIWALFFSLFNFLTVWCAQPWIKLSFVAFRCCYIVTRAWTRMLFDPCFESIALGLSRIVGRFEVNVSGIRNV